MDAIIINGQSYNTRYVSASCIWTLADVHRTLCSSSGTANLTAILDTGTPTGRASLSLVRSIGSRVGRTAYIDPRFVDIMYGADAETNGDFSVVPCNAQIDVSLVFGYVGPFARIARPLTRLPSSDTVFPIHPFDAIQPLGIADNGSVVCEGAFARLEGFPDGSKYALFLTRGVY